MLMGLGGDVLCAGLYVKQKRELEIVSASGSMTLVGRDAVQGDRGGKGDEGE